MFKMWWKSSRLVVNIWPLQNNYVHGLCRFVINIPWAGQLSLYDGEQVLFAKHLNNSIGKLEIKCHTHLLANGKHPLRWVLDNGSRQMTCKQTLQVKNEGALAERVRLSLQRGAVPLFFEDPCDSSFYNYQDDSLSPWFDRPDAHAHIDAKLATNQISETDAKALRHFVDEGYLILPDRLTPEMLVAANAAIDEAISTRYQGYEYGQSKRLEHMHLHWSALKQIWAYQPIHRWLSLIFEELSEPCQSLVFVFGSQQAAHQDTVHLTPFPAGYMCGVWVALESVQPDSGELLIYPQSHRLPRVYMKNVNCPKVREIYETHAVGEWSHFGEVVVKHWQRMVEEKNLTPIVYRPAAGEILIWHENLMHAGSKRLDLLKSRRSIVTHNFARGAVVYYDSTGEVGFSTPLN